MARVLIVCEGKDDQVVLREYLLRLWPGRVGKPEYSSGGSKFTLEIARQPVDPPHQVDVVRANSKDQLAQRVVEYAAPISGRPFDVVIVSFDPDTFLDPEKEFGFFVSDFASVTKAGPVGGFALSRSTSGWALSLGKQVIPLLPAPWRTKKNATFDDLPDERNLERVLIEGIVEALASEAVHEWALHSTRALLSLASEHGWKRALRVWNAALAPKTSEESFAASILQNPRTKEACAAAIDSTGLRAMLDAYVV